MKFLNLKVLSFAACLVVCIFIQGQFVWPLISTQRPAAVIQSDGMGYYKHLLSIFIDKDYAHQRVDERYVLTYEDRGVNKYFVGSAVMMAPFFAIGYAAAVLSKADLNGVGPPFEHAMALGGVFYLLLGLWFMFKALRKLGINEGSSILVVAVTMLGTNLLHYALIEFTMTHVYSFAAIACFAYIVIQLAAKPTTGLLIRAALCLGLITIIRPVNLMVILAVPFLAGCSQGFFNVWRFTFSKVLRVALALAAFVAVVMVQLISFKVQAGDWIIWSYANEGFYFTKPQVLPFLFSFKSGFFIYTPLMLVLLLSVIGTWKMNAFRSMSYVLFFAGICYVLSAWWSWCYGTSFSSRPMVDFYGILMLPAGYVLIKIRNWKPSLRVPAIVIASLLVGLNLFQTYQLNAGIITKTMNAGKYVYTFGHWNPETHIPLGGVEDVIPYHHKKTIIYRDTADFDSVDYHWKAGALDSTNARGKAARFAANPYGLKFRYRFPEMDFHALFIDLSLSRLELDSNACSDAVCVMRHYKADGTQQAEASFRINHYSPLPTGQWKEWHYSMELSGPFDQDDRLELFIWNVKGKSFLIDDIGMTIYGLKV